MQPTGASCEQRRILTTTRQAAGNSDRELGGGRDRWGPTNTEAASNWRSGGYLGQDGLREAGALEEGDRLLAADPAVAVQIRRAEVGVERRLHRTHARAHPVEVGRAGSERTVAGGGEIGSRAVCGGWWISPRRRWECQMRDGERGN
jgi:hypothetical protein